MLALSILGCGMSSSVLSNIFTKHRLNLGRGCELAAVGLGYTSFDLGRLARFASSEILNRPRRLRNESDRALPRDDRDGLSFHRRGEL